MGNDGVLMDTLAVLCGRGDELQDEAHSDIARITANIDFESEDW